MSRMGSYQAAAGRHGTTIVRASKGVPPRIGGGITEHPVTRAAAEALARDLRQLGAEVRVCPEDDDAKAFVYLSGCSFQKGDLPQSCEDFLREVIDPARTRLKLHREWFEHQSRMNALAPEERQIHLARWQGPIQAINAALVALGTRIRP